MPAVLTVIHAARHRGECWRRGEACACSLRRDAEAAVLLGVDVTVKPEELSTNQDFYGEGCGIPTPGGLEAIKRLAESDGVLLDPVYTSKAMAGLIAHVRAGAIDPGDTIVFLHTGGTPALFAHAEVLSR